MSNSNLFKEFEANSKEEWLAKIQKDLRGKSLEDLERFTSDGIKISPVYFAEDQKVFEQALKEHPKWDIVQEVLVLNTKEANKEALDHLNRGATSLLFYLNGDENLEGLLNNIDIRYICNNFVLATNPVQIANQLKALITKKGIEEVEIAGTVNFDPLENLCRTGNWFKSKEEDFNELKALNQTLKGEIKTLCINANLFGNAGASEAQQLGIALAMAYEYIHQLDLENSKSFWINLAIGSDYFSEIAKLRAFRRLWKKLQNELGFENSEVRIYTETAMRNKTIIDHYNNMIRSTAEVMAAVIGGASEVSVKGFNHSYGEPDFFGERIAKNQQNILQHESNFQQVRDMPKGSFFIENLTEEMATKAWEFFKKIEKNGGFLESVKSNWLQNKVEEMADAEQEKFDAGNQVLIGANKYQPTDEDLKSFVADARFSGKSTANTEVKPFKTTRLSEKIEQQILA